MKYILSVLLIIFFFGCKPKVKDGLNIIEDVLILEVPYEKQISVLKSLGYELNPKISETEMLRELRFFGFEDIQTEDEESFKKSIESYPYEILYYGMGWCQYDKQKKSLIYYSDQCITYDLEFIDPSSEYINLMERMGDITNGELSFSDISLYVDNNNYEWVSFKVNGIKKKWKLQKVGYIDDSIFSRFVYLTEEFNTKGRYTYFDSGSQQFVIDYATEKEQQEFNKKTGLMRQWLIPGKQFSKPQE